MFNSAWNRSYTFTGPSLELGSDDTVRRPGKPGPTNWTRADIRSTIGKAHLRHRCYIGSGTKISLPPTTHVKYFPDKTGPTNIRDLALVVQKTNEMTRQFQTRFYVRTKNEILDCTDQEAIAAFHHNVYDEGIRREILSTIV